MGIAVAGFDWDEGNREKCQKHGISLAEIEDVLTDDPRFAPDVRHTGAEDRFIAVEEPGTAGRHSWPLPFA